MSHNQRKRLFLALPPLDGGLWKTRQDSFVQGMMLSWGNTSTFTCALRILSLPYFIPSFAEALRLPIQPSHLFLPLPLTQAKNPVNCCT